MAGTQRSGSNLLRLMLGAHAGISAPPSTHMFRVFRGLAGGYGDLKRRGERREVIDDVRRLIELNVFAWEGGPPAAREIEQRWHDTSVAGLCAAVYDAHAERQGATAWICKSLENVRHLDELRAGIEGLSVLHLVRDGRDVALSFSRVPVGPKHAYVLAREWMTDQRAGMAADHQERTDPEAGRALRVRYEHLTAAPETVMPEVCALLGTHFSVDALDFHSSAEARSAPGRSPLWQNLDRPVMVDNTRKFTDPELRPFVEAFESTAFDVLTELGYEPLYAQRAHQYSPAEIERFVSADRHMREVARQGADRTTEALHRPQEEFIGALRRRRNA